MGQEIRGAKTRRRSRSHTPKFVCLITPSIFVFSTKRTTKFQSQLVCHLRRCAPYSAYFTLVQGPIWPEKMVWKLLGSKPSGQLTRYHYEEQPTEGSVSSEPFCFTSELETSASKWYSKLLEIWRYWSHWEHHRLKDWSNEYLYWNARMCFTILHRYR